MRTLVKLLSFLRPYWQQVFLSILLGAATMTVGIGLMGTSAYLIAMAALHPSIAVLQVSIVGVRFFGLARGIFRYLERLTSHSVNFHLLAEIRNWFYRAIEPRAPAGLQKYHSGDLLSRAIGDINTLEDVYVRLAAPPLVAGIILLGSSFFLGSFYPALGWIIAGGLLISGVVLPILIYWVSKKPARKVIEIKGQLNQAMVESVQGISDLLAFQNEKSQRRKVFNLGEALGQVQKELSWVEGTSNAGNMLVNQITLWFILWIAIPFVSRGVLDGVELAVIMLATLASFECVLPLAMAGQRLEGSLQAGERLLEIANSPIQVMDFETSKIPITNGIFIRDLVFRYQNGLPPVIDHLSLSIPTGKRIALVGPSGAGKSSLVKLLMRFWEFNEGEILWGGMDIRGIGGEQIRQRIGLISQSTDIFNTTLRENLSLAQPGIGDERLIQALLHVNLGEWFSYLPEGLDSWLGESGTKVSGGERQRIAAARCLLKDAPVMIWDEPFANLDSSTADMLLKSFLALSQGRSLIWITHWLSNLDAMDEIYVLKAGKLIEKGDHKALLRQNGFYSKMWHLQNKELDIELLNRP